MELTQIELIYMSIFTLIALVGILTYTQKMSIGIALTSIIFGSAICYVFAPYMQMIIRPIGYVIMYGYSINWYVGVAIFHLFSLILLLGVATYNMIVSGGKITWA